MPNPRANSPSEGWGAVRFVVEILWVVQHLELASTNLCSCHFYISDQIPAVWVTEKSLEPLRETTLSITRWIGNNNRAARTFRYVYLVGRQRKEIES